MVPRWTEAFPGAVLCTPAQVSAQAGPEDHVWILADLDDWAGLVLKLARREAIVVVLAYRPDVSQAFQALDAGARGYAHALSAPALLQQVALVTANQGLWVWPELLQQVVGATFRLLCDDGKRVPEVVLDGLTSRERDVALAVAAGKSNKEVARQLDITERTVKAHLGAVFRKLHVRDRMQLVLALSGQQVSMP
ncbi:MULTISPECIES: response regulator transcription factor [Modicisalibacter]|uniref:response regulator transcription factor n=1 Tax=Modicisalibacter TaxID=574347 RepID=UPI001CCE99D0|nr:response regulator transcription factor [Halomonas coralii]